MRKLQLLLTIAVITLGVAPSAQAEVPQFINCQGVLEHSAGDPITTSTWVYFVIWSDSLAGDSLWWEYQWVYPDGEGRFNVLLGAAQPLYDWVFAGSEAYLGITVDTYPVMFPRQRMVSVAFAYHAAIADSIAGSGGYYLPLDGGTMSGAITNTGNPSITMGPGNFGSGNTNSGTYSFVAGQNNEANGDYSTVGGGKDNEAFGDSSTVGGGTRNLTGSVYSTVGGGTRNYAGGLASTIGGGQGNSTNNQNSTIGGGENNIASGTWSTIGGGNSDTASGSWSTIGGGNRNAAIASHATVGGGGLNRATGGVSTIGGGGHNVASGEYSTVPGGFLNEASGDHSFAAGATAVASHEGSVVLSAKSWVGFAGHVRSGGVAQMVLRADSGIFITNSGGTLPVRYDPANLITTPGGAYLSGNGTDWTNFSDRNKKENFVPVDRRELLEKITSLDINRWNYIEDDDRITHIGPVAQDFYALFDVGGNDKAISTIDPAGIALAAIQELHEQNQEQQQRIEELETLVRQLLENQR